MNKALLLSAAAAIALAGCTANKATQSTATTTNAKTELSGTWRLTAYEIGGGTAQFDPTADYTLQFNSPETTFGITTDCNNIIGSYTVTPGDTIRFTGLGMTRMACPDPVVEQAMLGILSSPDAYAIQSGNTIRVTAPAVGEAYFSRAQQ